jgi:hypothetical protein
VLSCSYNHTCSGSIQNYNPPHRPAHLLEYWTGHDRETANLSRSSFLTILSASIAVEERSTLVYQHLDGCTFPDDLLGVCMYLGTTRSPIVSLAINASFHLSTHKHHLHPSFSPTKPGRGVIRSLPLDLEYSRNSLVTTPPMKCFPPSSRRPQQ